MLLVINDVHNSLICFYSMFGYIIFYVLVFLRLVRYSDGTGVRIRGILGRSTQQALPHLYVYL
jgi:hypothetical protein